MVEPLPYTKDDTGRAVWDDDPDKLLRAVGVSAALGGTSAYTWLKVQATADVVAVAAMTTQPVLLLGGALGADPSAVFDAWAPASSSRRCAAWSREGRCCIPATVTSPAPSNARPCSWKRQRSAKRARKHERAKRAHGGRATAREPDADGVRGRSPRRKHERSERMAAARPPGSRTQMGSGGAAPGGNMSEASAWRPQRDRQGAGRRWGPGAQPPEET